MMTFTTSKNAYILQTIHDTCFSSEHISKLKYVYKGLSLLFDSNLLRIFILLHILLETYKVMVKV